MKMPKREAKTWGELKDSSYTRLRKQLLRKKGSPLQREFLASLESRELFCRRMEEWVGFEPGDVLPTVVTRLSESQFSKPPLSTEREMFATWHNVLPAQACRTTFWGRVTVWHIEAEKIEPWFLVSQNEKGKGGRVRIEELRRQGSEKDIDDAVRTSLRRMSGLPEARGALRSVYADCPLARAWWRCYLATEACERSGANRDDVLNVFRRSTTYWEKLIMLVISRNSVVGDAGVRTALVWALSEFVEDEAWAHLFKAEMLERIARALGIRLAWQELSVLPIRELKELILREMLPKDS